MIDVGRDFERMRDYIVGRLPDEEREAFEDRLGRDPALVRELEQTLRLREGLTTLRERGELLSEAPRIRSYRTWVPTLAAAALAGVALFFLLMHRAAPSPVLMAALESGVSAPRVTAHFTFVPMRGNDTPALNLPPAGLVEFRAAAGRHDAASRYRVTLSREDAGGTIAIGELASLTPGEDGYVHLFADAARLTPGRYVLRVQGTEGLATAGVFPFSLTPGGAPSP